ncbi:MAG: hypothetical protein AAGU21_15280 [Solidesulfovibrio sp.]|uniref:hypothetical protein n=1 Tax=Solidesulfovibrio sp. TaxID=2910990 RepID=UPI002B21B81C|nr:hypothetical protein [Solidesulfovibrio sp.]MEA4857522.1 hypothetical protein [Solidesulfovibrio sp.]
MHKGNAFVSTLISMVFIMGMLAPVPECYVTRVVGPLRASIAHANLALKGMPAPSFPASCCLKVGKSIRGDGQCPLAPLKLCKKPYAPAFEAAEAPGIPLALLPVPFHKPIARTVVFFYFIIEKQPAMSDPIPILLRKQSFLI